MGVPAGAKAPLAIRVRVTGAAALNLSSANNADLYVTHPDGVTTDVWNVPGANITVVSTTEILLEYTFTAAPSRTKGPDVPVPGPYRIEVWLDLSTGPAEIFLDPITLPVG